jgi:hypothetical protein
VGWSGIWLIALRPGEDAEAAVAHTTDASIDDDDDGPAIVANDDAEPAERSEATNAWCERIVALVCRDSPGFAIVEEQRDDDGHRQWFALDDPDEPVVATVYADQVQLEPARGYRDPDDQPGLGFRTMWRYCQLLAGEACVAHDPDDDEIIDLSLDEDEARHRYNWI